MLKGKRWQQMWPGTRLELPSCAHQGLFVLSLLASTMCMERCEGKIRVLC